METRYIPADWTRRRYRRKYATGNLYRELKECMKYGILSSALLLLTPNIGAGWLGLGVIILIAALNLMTVLLAVWLRSKGCAVAAAAFAALWGGYAVYSAYTWIASIWNSIRYLGLDVLFWSGKKDYTIQCILLLLSSGMGVWCAVKMRKVFKKIDIEYDDLMANLQG